MADLLYGYSSSFSPKPTVTKIKEFKKILIHKDKENRRGQNSKQDIFKMPWKRRGVCTDLA
jgi:hypothetical protein